MKKRKTRRSKQRGGPVMLRPTPPVARPTRKPTRARWRWVKRLVLVLIAILSIAGVAAWWRAGQPPQWWSEVGAQAAHPEAPARARRFESGLVSLGGGGTRHAVAIEERDANAWLAHRLPDWLENQGIRPPPELADVGVRFETGLIRMAVRLTGDTEERFLAAAFRPELRDSAVALRLVSVSSGRLALSAGVFERTIRRLVEQAHPSAKHAGEAQALVDALLHAEPITDAGEFRVDRLEVEPGRIVLAITP